MFCVTHVSVAGRFWNGDISMLILEISHTKGREAKCMKHLLIWWKTPVYTDSFKKLSKPGHGQFFFSVWNSHYIPSVRPTTESSFCWQLWLPGSTFVIVDPEQGIVFPLIKRKTLNYLMQLEPWSYKYTYTEKSEKECFSNMFFSIIILCYIVNIW